jgi:hypothetical protein
MKTLQEYYELPMLDSKVRDKMHNKLIEMILDDKDKYHNDIAEMIDYFITEMGNADFIRLSDKILNKTEVL